MSVRGFFRRKGVFHVEHATPDSQMGTPPRAQLRVVGEHHACQIASTRDSASGIGTDRHLPGKMEAAAVSCLAPIIAPRRPLGETNDPAVWRMSLKFLNRSESNQRGLLLKTLSTLLHNSNPIQMQDPRQLPQENSFLAVRLNERQLYGRSKDLQHHSRKTGARAHFDHVIRRTGGEQVTSGKQ